jgi:plastocyanin
MRRLALAATLAALVVASAGGAHAASSSRAPSRLLVAGDEYSIRLSRGAVKHGPAVIQFVNRGEDPHDLKLKRISRSPARTVSAPELRSGGIAEIATRLRAGHYRLWCSLPQHRDRGMRAVLTVRGGR